MGNSANFEALKLAVRHGFETTLRPVASLLIGAIAFRSLHVSMRYIHLIGNSLIATRGLNGSKSLCGSVRCFCAVRHLCGCAYAQILCGICAVKYQPGTALLFHR